MAAGELAAGIGQPGFKFGDDRRAFSLTNGQPLRGRSAIDGALDGEQASISRTASRALGQTACGFSPRAFLRSALLRSASTKNLRRACASTPPPECVR